MALNSILAVIGLLLDIIGAYFIAQHFLLITPRDIKDDGYFGFRNIGIEIGECRQKADAMTGFLIMAAGFIGQIGNNFETTIVVTDYWVVGCLIITLPSAVIIAKVIRHVLFTRYINKIDQLEYIPDEYWPKGIKRTSI